jgi:hypothetical protein
VSRLVFRFRTSLWDHVGACKDLCLRCHLSSFLFIMKHCWMVCMHQDGVVRSRLAHVLANKTDVRYVNSLASSEGLEQVETCSSCSSDAWPWPWSPLLNFHHIWSFSYQAVEMMSSSYWEIVEESAPWIHLNTISSLW